MTVKRQILKSASAIAAVTVISRICGYLRDQRVALLLGTSPAADALLLVFGIPSLVRRTVGEGAFGASFIPVFTGYLREKPGKEAWKFAQKVFWDMAVVLVIVSIAGVVFSKQVVSMFAVLGGKGIDWNLAIFLNRIIFPAVLFIGLTAIASAILNSVHVFALPAGTPILFNLVFITFSTAIFYRPILRLAPQEFQSPAVGIAVGILIGGAIQFLVLVPGLLGHGMRFPVSISFADPGVRRVARLMGPAILGVSVYQINFFVDRIFAASSRMPSGSITSLYLADRVMQLALGVYAIAMSTALLPTMSRQVAAGKFDEMKRTFAFSLRIVSFIAIPAGVGLILLRKPIVQVLFQHGAFVSESTALTARALFFYSLGLPAFAAIKLITPMYYSTQDTMTPARVGAYSLVLNVALNSIFLFFFFGQLLNGSPALASSLAAYFNFVALFLIFRRRYGELGIRGLVSSMSKMAVCAVGMAAACQLGLRFSGFAAAQHFVYQAGLLAGMILSSVGIYFGLAWVLRCEELSEFLLLLRRAEPGGLSASGVEA